jgi:hypothetical protein
LGEEFALENLVDPGFWHGKLKEDSDEPDHDEGPGRPQHGQVVEFSDEAEDLARLQYDGDPVVHNHGRVELAPVIFQVRGLALRGRNKRSEATLANDQLRARSEAQATRPIHSLLLPRARLKLTI